MANSISADVISGDSVYGVQQMQYTADGVSGLDFTSAVTVASFKQAAAIEEATVGYSEVVRVRQKKVSELGDVLAIIAEAMAKLPVKDGKPGDKVTVANASFVRSVCSYYSITLHWDGNSDQMTREKVMKAETTLEYQIDKEDNLLQQDLVSMQSYISKRDNAYSNASKVVKKALDAATSTIRNIGS